MLPLSALARKYAARPAVVLGGGISLPEQFKQCPAGALLLSTNQHGVVLTQCDYVVCIDDILKRDLQIGGGQTKRIHQFNTPIISTRRWADYRIFEQPAHNSAIVAAWAAWVMGCAPIIAIGIDCYVGGTYYHTPRAKSSGPTQLFEHHINRWIGFRDRNPSVMLRAVGGPLLKVFPRYDAAEAVPLVPDETVLRAACTGKIIDLVKPLQVHGYTIPRGVHEVSAAEARHAQRVNAIGRG